ncbi:unnamed protein product, partial [Discosporangium mesarthrocarpum]
MAMTRCFLSVPGLPKALWPEAVQTAVYIRKQVLKYLLMVTNSLRSLDGQNSQTSSFESFVFGVTAFVHMETRKTKLLQRGWEGRFVGYSIDSPAYLVWRPGT